MDVMFKLKDVKLIYINRKIINSILIYYEMQLNI